MGWQKASLKARFLLRINTNSSRPCKTNDKIYQFVATHIHKQKTDYYKKCKKGWILSKWIAGCIFYLSSLN